MSKLPPREDWAGRRERRAYFTRYDVADKVNSFVWARLYNRCPAGRVQLGEIEGGYVVRWWA